MARYRSLFYLLPELVRTLTRPRFTVEYPFQPPEIPPYFRGKVVVDATLCHGCGRCTRNCPADALHLVRDGDRFRLMHYRDRCAYCGQCADDCPQKALTLVSEFESATPEREALAEVLVDKERPRRR